MTDLRYAEAPAFSNRRKLRLAYFVSHPIQYQAPLLRRIAEESDIDLTVFFGSDISVRDQGYSDDGFGVLVKWDIPLLDGFKYEFLPVLLDADWSGFLRPLNHGIKRRIREGKFDAVWVHGYSGLTSLQAIWAASSLKIPVLLRGESTLFDRPRSHLKLAAKRLFLGMLRRRISAVLAIGSANTAYWRHYLGEHFPIFPCYYCVNNQFFQDRCEAATRSREEFRDSLGLEAGRPVILYSAKLMPRKRCGDLLEAFLQISKSGNLSSNPYLLIVGDGQDRAALESRAREAKPGDVHFLGFQNQTELPRFYDLCDVFVLASVDEPWGLAINEVMNAGRAVIVTDQVGCQRDLVHAGVNGCVIGARDVDGLANSLRVILEDEQTWQAMGAQSLRIIRDFTFNQNLGGLRKALQLVVPGFSAASVD